jgi:DNA polymerase III delta subunit
MMILHGENNLLSRQKLTNEIANFKLKTQGEILRHDGHNLNLMDLRQSLESASLFRAKRETRVSLLGDSRLVIIENLFSGRVGKEKQKIIDYLKKTVAQNLIIWEGKKIDGRTLTSFKGQVLRFDLDPVIFRFLDSLSPGKAKISLTLLHQCLTQDPPEIIFFMLARQIRHLILAADLGKKGLGQMESWRAEKLIRQARYFTLIKLMKIYRQLLKIEVQQKTGQTPFTLSSQLDLLIASL